MSADPYRIVKYDGTLRNALLELQTLLWNPSPAVRAAYLEWKFHQNPYARGGHIYLALYQDRVVGMRGFYGSRWEFGSPVQQRTILCAGDLVIAPEHRGVGLFTRIMEHAVADLDSGDREYLFNTSAGAITRLGALTMGWESIGPISLLRRPPSPEPESEETAPVAPFDRFDRFHRRQSVLSLKNIGLSDSPRPEAMADLVRRLGHDGRLRHVRDATYFDWRFRNPLSTYRFLYLGRRRLAAYLVLQTEAYANSDRPLKIIDFEAESDTAAMEILAAALPLGEPNALLVWKPTLSGPRQAQFRLHGFMDEDATSLADSFWTILIRPATRVIGPQPWLLDGIDLLNAESWDLRQVYTDGC